MCSQKGLYPIYAVQDSLVQWFSSRSDFARQGHLVMSGYILVVTTGQDGWDRVGVGCTWHLMGRSQRCC